MRFSMKLLLVVVLLVSITVTAVKAQEESCYLIGHAHIDAVWLWRRMETIDVVCKNTFTSVLDLMDKYPGFYFT